MSGQLTFSFAPFSYAALKASADATFIAFLSESLVPGPQTAALLPDLDWIRFRRAAAEEGFRGQAREHMTYYMGGRRLIFVGVGILGLTAVDLGNEAAAVAGYSAAVIISCEWSHGTQTPEAAAEVALGYRLASYRFHNYRTRRQEPQFPEQRYVSLLCTSAIASEAAYSTREEAVAEGVELARALVNEPPNILTPPEFARRTKALTHLGLEVDVYGERQLEQLGFHALLGVGRGSHQESHVAILRWNGVQDLKSAPLAFVGKGVCFDSGGLSIKSAEGMADMKGDMAGAACVTGLMVTLALRKAQVNVVGVLGLVENMPSGSAQRPGDIVRSLSGQTIEIIETDYEGRLVLADLLWHAQAAFAPRFMIDLATLTQAVITGVGLRRAGLFSNDDALADAVVRASVATGELIWRLPIDLEFDEEMNSDIADMRNIDPPYGGASTAACFIQRFVNHVPWVHLDIGGPAFELPKRTPGAGWATGWGVRLLDRLVRDLESGPDSPDIPPSPAS